MKPDAYLLAIGAWIWFLYAAAMASFFVYLQDPEWYHQLVLESKPMPVLAKMHHIEFSLFLAGSGWAGLYLWTVQVPNVHFNILRRFTLLAALINIILLHFLSARTGLLAFYAGLALWWIWNYRHRWKQLFLGSMALLGVLVVAALLLPSLRNRVVNTYDDLRTVTDKSDPNDKSFAQRWEAWKAAVHLMDEQPLWGWGMRELATEMSRAHEEMGSKVLPWNRKMPHNQFLETGIQGGYIALLLLLAGLVFWVREAVRQGNAFLLAMMGMLLTAFVFESLLEQQSGVMWCVLWPVFAACAVGKNLKNP
jgi:O-antigen ligase